MYMYRDMHPAMHSMIISIAIDIDVIYNCIYMFSKLSWRINHVSGNIYLISSQVANSWWMMI